MPSLRSTLRWLLSATIIILSFSLQGCAASAGRAQGKDSTIRACDGQPPIDGSCVCQSPSIEEACKGHLLGTLVAQRGNSVLAMAPVPAESWLDRDKSYEITPAERERFVEASNRFKKYVIPQGIRYGETFWLDNERLVFASREYPGWKARPHELSRVVSYNLLTGEIVDSGYRGDVECLNHLGDVIIYYADRHYSYTLAKERYNWLTGKWGNILQQVDRPLNSVVPPYLCRFAPYGDPIFRDPPEALKPNASKITPLLTSHGSISEAVVRERGQLHDRVELIKPSGERVLLGERRINHYFFVYQPWDAIYFELELPPRQPRSISPQGVVYSHPIPALFGVWKKNLYSSIAAFTSGRGLVWSVQQKTGYWRKQGIFLQTDLELLRIEEGEPDYHIKSSPDGCKVHASVIRGDPYKGVGRKPMNIVIDLCKENDK